MYHNRFKRYPGIKKRVCCRIDQAHLNFLKRKSLSINRTVNAALETFFYEYDHNKVDQVRRDDIINPSFHIMHPKGSKSTQLRIEAMFFDRMEMYMMVKAKVIWYALENYIDMIKEGRVSKEKLTELDEARKYWKS